MKFVHYFLPFICIGVFGSSVRAQTLIAHPHDPAAEWIRYDFDVTQPPYNAVANDGLSDLSAFRRAVQACARAGGGVVYVPPGEYILDDKLRIEQGVTLRGVWLHPATNPNPNAAGTEQSVLRVEYDPAGNPSAFTHIQMARSSGLRDINIWDPLQPKPTSGTPFRPIARPWTIQQGGEIQATVERVTIYNAYNGIQLGPAANELGTYKDIYMTVLNKGLVRDKVFDVARFQRIDLSPAWWRSSGLANAPVSNGDYGRLVGYTRNNSIGIDFKHFAWTWMYDIDIRDMNIGIVLTKTDQQPNNDGGTGRGPCGGFLDLQLTNNRVGIALGDVNDQGLVFADVQLFSNLRDAIGVLTLDGSGGPGRTVEYVDTFRGIAEFNDIIFNGAKLKYAVEMRGTGNLSLTNVRFKRHAAGGADVYARRGKAVVTSSVFAESDGHVRIDDGRPFVTLVSNDYPDSLVAVGPPANVASQVRVDDRDFPVRNYGGNKVYRYDDFIFRPAQRQLFNVRDAAYGAVGDGSADDTPALRAALAAAEGAGGGIVYLPPGYYRTTGQLAIPTGVELRGVYDTPHFTNLGYRQIDDPTLQQGSVIAVDFAKNNAAGQPAILLRPGSSVRGFKMWYPQQEWVDFSPTDVNDPNLYQNISGGIRFAYPHAIRGAGNNVHLRDITLVNAFQGVDLSQGCSDYHVNYLGGTVLREGLKVSGRGGDIRNVQFNFTYWRRSNMLGDDNTAGGNNISPARYVDTEWAIQRRAVYSTNKPMNAFVLDNAKDQNWLHCFVFKAKNGFTVNGNTEGYLAAIGSDESETPIRINGGGTGNNRNRQLNVINGQFVAQKSPFDKRNVRVTAQAGANQRINLYNTITWGNSPGPDGGLQVSGGDVLIQNINFERHGEVKDFGTGLTNFFGVLHNGGRLTLTAPFFKKKIGQNGANVFGKYFRFVGVGPGDARIASYFWGERPVDVTEAEAVVYDSPATESNVSWYPTWCVNEGRADCFTTRTIPSASSRAEAEELRAYPNPVMDRLSVTVPEDFGAPIRYRLMNATGSLLREGRAESHRFTLGMAPLPAGTYFLEVSGKEEPVTLRIVKRGGN
jgi:hypothetical protein